MIQDFYSTNTREYINIPSCSGKLVFFDSSLLQERIFVYTLVKLYKAYLKKQYYNYRLLVASVSEYHFIIGNEYYKTFVLKC